MLLTHTHLIAIISILGSIAKAQDGLDGPGIVVPTVAWTEFTFYSAKDANEALGTMSPEGPKDPKEKDFSGYGDVKCVKANGDDGIGNNIIESARGKGVKDYYCVVQWDKPDCSGGHLWMDDHMSEDHQWTRGFQFDTERLARSASVSTGKCSPEIRGTV